MDEHCSQTLALNQGSVETVRLRLTKAPNYPDAMFCAMRVQGARGKETAPALSRVSTFRVPKTLYVRTAIICSCSTVPRRSRLPFRVMPNTNSCFGLYISVKL
ncbi:hypothetical protein DPMN_177198 [Dreissena polymorpha]|uniref:Uncharacterized protein n=1 Tax=Dreissena polymorpha TaxID=45954 RepID=A0A9D4IIT4_DREPO|nr:hypothetical protein DPMN_177198 [Dreissena polymorpha]